MERFTYINELDIFENETNRKTRFSKVQVLSLTYNDLAIYKKKNIYLKSAIFILVQEGGGNIIINFKEHEIQPQSLFLLSYGHIVKLNSLKNNFKCTVLYVSLDFIEEMYNSEMIYKKTKYSVHLYNHPILALNKIDNEVLNKRLLLVDEMTNLTDHLYYKAMILESLQIYFLDLSSIIEKNGDFEIEHEQTNEEMYFEKYLNLLLSKFIENKPVDYYSGFLNITPHYLNKITKKIVGETVTKMTENLLFAEARGMLQNPSMSIKEIASQLKFSDQSAFGKFFKRKAGISARHYRNNIL